MPGNTISPRPGITMLAVLRILEKSSYATRNELVMALVPGVSSSANLYRAIRTCLARGLASQQGHGNAAVITITDEGKTLIRKYSQKV